MADMAGDGSVDKAVAFDQEHSELVLNVDWWWAVHICLCAIAVVANLIFIITVIHNRYETSSDFYFIQLVQLLNLRHMVYTEWWRDNSSYTIYAILIPSSINSR